MAPRPPTRWLRCLFLILSIAAVTAGPPACTVRKAAVPWPEENWATATPESQGMDSALLAEAVRAMRRDKVNIHSILVLRNGHAVLDASFYPYDGRGLHDVASVTKSVTATLVGQAAGEGIFPPLDTPVVQFMSGGDLEGWGGGWQKVTFETLITMSSGLECGDPPAEETIFEVRRSGDWARAIRSIPVVDPPGEAFDYCSPNYHLLSAAVTRASGMPLGDFARERLFAPLGIRSYAWPQDPQGISFGWGDLRLRPADMARIGYLYLNDGMWKDRRVLPDGWVKAALKQRLATPDGRAGYGYGWWLATGDFKGVYEARGRGGQNITVWPQRGIILVTTGGGYDRDTVVNALLPAVRSDGPLPENPGAFEDLGRAVAAAVLPPDPEPVGRLPVLARTVSGRWFTMDDNILALRRFRLSFREGAEEAALTVDLGGEEYDFTVGLDAVYRFSGTSPSGDPAAVRGNWTAGNRFILDYNEVPRINRFRMEMTFAGDEVRLAFSEPTGQLAGEVKGRIVP
ncbi:MAG: serine hydrolase [bacterium]|nr:MAG: serine hydrolase [bacterium]